MKINKNNIATGKAGMSYIQIVLLVMFTIAISYLVGVEVESVDAAGYGGSYCCEKAKSGAVCQMVTDPSQCAGQTSPTKCEDTGFCQPGCCYSSETGVCYENSPRIKCSNDQEFINNANCNVPECKKGCCTIGNNAIWTTDKNCQIESNFTGNPENFTTGIKSEIECIFSVQKDTQGACVYNLDNYTSSLGCKYVTLSECNTMHKLKNEVANPYFFSGKFCSDGSLNTTCNAKDHQGCVDGKEDVYWFDSCDNPESVAQDCNFFKGSYCGLNPNDKTKTKYSCNDINCYINGVKRINGESWCEYDGTIGNGTDPVGSRHIKHICFMGKEKIEPCADYRNEICVQKDTQTSDGSIFSDATCKVNNWRKCYSFNNLEEDKMVQKCEAESDCYVDDVNIDDNFHFKACVPNYPPGFSFDDMLSEEQVQNGQKTQTESQCSIASVECTETWKWCLFTGWKCINNCNCHEQVFTDKMNQFCHSLGDCGAWTNYNGTFTDGGYALTAEKESPPKLDDAEISKIKGYANKNPNQAPAEPGNVTLETQNVVDMETVSGYEGVLAGVSGSLGSPLLAKILSEQDNNNFSSIVSETSPSAINYAQYSSDSFSNIAKGIKADNPGDPMTGAMIGAGIGFGLGYLIGYLMGLESMWSILLGAIIGLIIFLFLFCKIDHFKVDFKCYPWERPTQGDCNACNQLNSPCTKYRCESLGQTCNLANEGTTMQMCIDKCKDHQSIPEITPWAGINNALPTSGYVYKPIDNGFKLTTANGSCIDPYTKVYFGIKLAESNDPNADCKYAQCKIGTIASQTYDEMPNYFGDDSSFLPYHKGNVIFPSPEALRFQYNLSDEKIKQLSTMDFYVRCKSATGQINPQPYKIEACINLAPDYTPPTINKIIPESGSYLPYGKTSQNFSVYTSEPANCRWSNGTQNYDDMENVMDCDTSLSAYTNIGWKCDSTLTDVNNTVYIKCRDISVNNNTMSDPYEYTLLKSSSILEIKNIQPATGENIISGTNPAEVTLRLETSGGAQGGVAVCYWAGNGFSDRFTETNASFHSYSWNLAAEGSYNLNFNCVDIAGNNASASTSFTVKIDQAGPQINRVYKSGGLVVMTDEKSECRYSFDSNFNFDNSTAMSGNGLAHIAQWKAVNYYVQCIDDYKNKGGIFKIKGYELV